MAAKALPCPTVLRLRYVYDPETGLLFWRFGPRAGQQAFTTKSGGYHSSLIKGKMSYAHRVAWAIVHGAWPNGEIDHINGDRADNRLANLRVVTRSENCRNLGRSHANKSGHTGVIWSKDKSKWESYIKTEGVRKFLGRFDVLDDAVSARRAAEARLGFHPNHGRG